MAPSERARRRGGKRGRQREQLWCPLPVRHLSCLPNGEAAHTGVAPAASQEAFLGICVYMRWCLSIYKQLVASATSQFCYFVFFVIKGEFSALAAAFDPRRSRES